MQFTFTEARAEVVAFLEAQDSNFFEERETTKEVVLANVTLIEAIAYEHLHCVNRFGNDREWSLKDACGVEPGIWQGVIPEKRV